MEQFPRVPPSLHGVWQRTLLQTAGNAIVDSETPVRWMQTASLFGDLRVPAAVSEAPLPPLEACRPEHLTLLTTCNSFAGHTTLAGDVCTWHREVDLQPPSGVPDVGLLRYVSEDKIYEDDVEGVDYHEVWERLLESKGGPVWALRLSGAGTHGRRRAFLLRTGDCFMFVADRTTGSPLPAVPGDRTCHFGTTRLAASLGALEGDLAAQQAALSYEASYGRVALGSEGEPPWRIELSTLPGRVGRRLLPVDAPGGVEELLAWGGGRLAIGGCPPEGGWEAVRDDGLL